MPNWCENTLYIEAPQSEIEAILAAANVGLLNYLRPEPAHEPNSTSWYDWRVEHWGTKWDINNLFGVSHGDGWINLSFDSAWSPPISALAHWQAQDSENRSYNIRYLEWGNAFCGEADSRLGDESFDIPGTAAQAKQTIPEVLLEEFNIIESLETMEQEIIDEGPA